MAYSELFSVICLSLGLPLLMGAKPYQPEVAEKPPLITIRQPMLNNPVDDLPSPITQPNRPTVTGKIYTQEDLITSPKLLQRTMESTLISQNIKHIELVLPYYQKMPQADPVLIHYAEGLIAQYHRNYPKAINAYRAVLAEQPQLSNVRFYLAMSQYANNQKDSALEQFKKLRAEKLPQPVRETVAQAISRIEQQQHWDFYFNIYYQQDENINDAPEARQIGRWTFDDKQTAHGVHMDLAASKRLNLKDHVYTAINLRSGFDCYWDNKDYNDVSLRLGNAWGYQSAQWLFEVEPFANKRWFGNHSYSYGLGVKTALRYQINTQLSLNNVNELSKRYFNHRTHLDGRRQSHNLSINYRPNARQSFSLGVSRYMTRSQFPADSFDYQGLTLDWGQEWLKGISSQLSLSWSERENKGKDFFQIQRQDDNFTASAQLWHRNLHFYGFTPRLMLQYEKTDSNHFYYDDKREFTTRVAFSKQF